MTERKVPAARDFLVRADDRGPEETARHPMNPQAELHGFELAPRTGLRRVGVNLFRVPPGKVSMELHVHHSEEEWAYVLSGRGVARIGDETFEIGPGDFLGFPPSTLAHALENPGTVDLVYLCGGERAEVEVGDLPRVGKRIVRIGHEGVVYPLGLGQAFCLTG